jgi:hypothetical protein
LLEHFTPEPSMAPRTLKNSFGDDEWVNAGFPLDLAD